jgi:hypothetical protein
VRCRKPAQLWNDGRWNEVLGGAATRSRCRLNVKLESVDSENGPLTVGRASSRPKESTPRSNDRTWTLPGFATPSVGNGLKEQIAPYIRTFVCDIGIVPLSLMGLAGWLPIAIAHSWCCSHFGFGQPRSDLFAIIA